MCCFLVFGLVRGILEHKRQFMLQETALEPADPLNKKLHLIQRDGTQRWQVENLFKTKAHVFSREGATTYFIQPNRYVVVTYRSQPTASPHQKASRDDLVVGVPEVYQW
jgi:hypothetical protein